LRLSSDFVGRTAVSVHEAAIKCSRFINVIKGAAWQIPTSARNSGLSRTSTQSMWAPGDDAAAQKPDLGRLDCSEAQ
jgi:hypothetical protein